jgi:glutamine synthetase
MNAAELVVLACCDLGGVVRGRAIFANDLADRLRDGVGWVPANQALTPTGPLADGNPFGSIGDLRLLPDPEARLRIEGADARDQDTAPASALELLICDIVGLDGTPWEACTRSFLRATLATLEAEHGVCVRAAFEHEFQLLRASAAPPAFSLRGLREAEPFASDLMAALADAGLQPERIFAEYAPHQFEVPLGPAAALVAADRALMFRETVRELAARHGERATFVPLLDPAEAGNGVHIHFSLHDPSGAPLLAGDGPGGLSELAGAFAGGILAHAPALTALTAPSPVSAARLAPHRWSAGAACLGRQNRETLLRVPPVVPLSGTRTPEQVHLEFRAADAAANPHLALAAILSAGAEGIRRGLPAPPVLERDPAELSEDEAERFGVGALPGDLGEALAAWERDEAAFAWLPPLLRDAYRAVKRSEWEEARDAELSETCKRYAGVY